MKQVVKCFNQDIHRMKCGEGHIVLILDNDSLYVHCSDRACKRWTRLKISFPGIKLDLSKAAIEQTLMPEGYHFDLEKAPTVIISAKGNSHHVSK